MSANMLTGSLGVPHLEKLWRHATRQNTEDHGPQNWNWNRIVIEGLNLPLEETLQYLAQQRPSLADFERWLLERNEGSIEPLRIERINATVSGAEYSAELKAAIRKIDVTDPVLTAEDLSFWEQYGYVIVHNAIAPEDCRAAELAVWDWLKMNPQDPGTWYQSSTHGIMRQFFHHPALKAIRSSARIHKAFAQIWGTADLWATVDRVSFNPPEREGWKFPGPNLHWDISLTPPIRFNVSGLIYLTDYRSAARSIYLRARLPSPNRRLAGQPSTRG